MISEKPIVLGRKGAKMLWINGKMTDLTKKDAIHKLVDAKCFLERYSNPHDKWTEAINIGIEAIEIVMDQEEQEPTTKNDLGVDWESYKDADGNSLDYLILNVLQNSFDCGDAYGYTIADKIIGLLSSVTPQEPILDKIRAEINGMTPTYHNPDWSITDLVPISEVLKVIDKYKAESEDKDGQTNN